MRRFSQRNSLVTLSEINITPLLDLAFVLLIIFVITTPLLEQSLAVNLPRGGDPEAKFDPNNVKTVEISSTGVFVLNRTRMMPDVIERELVRTFRGNPNMVVVIRADKDAKSEYLFDIIDRCRRNGITKFSFSTQPNR
jgi:biopolymer transport protein ExbD